MGEIQKEIQLRLSLRSAPLFIITKQLDTTIDNLFYRTLEERCIIREGVLRYIEERHSGREWAHRIVEGLKSETLHLFMQFSHETLIALE